MAFIGLRKPIIARRTGSKKYEKPFAFGKAVALQIAPNYAEGQLYADDVQAEYDKEFNFAETTLGTSTIPMQAYSAMFGHTVDEEQNGVTMNANDENGFVGMGWITVQKVDGVRSYIGNFLYKVKFSEPSEDYATKGESIEYKTPSISGRALAEDDGDWKDVKTFDTEQDAYDWIMKEKFGQTEATASEAKVLPEAKKTANEK